MEEKKKVEVKVEKKTVDIKKWRERQLAALNQMKNQAKAQAIAARLLKH